MKPTPRARSPYPGPGSNGALAVVTAGALGMLALVALGGWVVAGMAGALAGRPRPFLDFAEVARLTVELIADHLDLPGALHALGTKWAPSAKDCWLALSFLIAGSFALGAIVVVTARGARALRRPRPVRDAGARWARRGDLRALIVTSAPVGRVVVGEVSGRLIAVERHHSLLVAGPTQSGKTSGLAIPALLDWQGPAVAASVKSDLVRATRSARAARGRALVYDPTQVSGAPGNTWSPLAEAATWPGARRVASALCSLARAGGGGLEDGAFWYATAEKLLAPLLHAAALAGASIGEVVRWVDTEEIDEVDAILALSALEAPRQAFGASVRRDDRQRSSVYATTETILAAFADPLVLASASGNDIDPTTLVASGGSDTCYLVAPAHEQERLQPVFVALLRSFLDAAFNESARRGAPLDPPLLVVLDEAANIAPLANLDAVAATAASHGVQLVTLWQDLAQVQARYGQRAATVVNNHRAKLICSGIADPATLEHVRQLAGEEQRWSESTSVDGEGRRSTTRSPNTAALAPADVIRRMPPGEAMLLYGHLPPVRLKLRPFFKGQRFMSSARRASATRPPGAVSERAPGSAARSRRRGRRRRGGESGGRC